MRFCMTLPQLQGSRELLASFFSLRDIASNKTSPSHRRDPLAPSLSFIEDNLCMAK